MVLYLKNRPMLISALGCAIVSVCGFYSPLLLLAVSVLFILSLGFTILRKIPAIAFALSLVLIAALNCFGTLSEIKELEKLSGINVNVKAVVCSTTYKSDAVYSSEVEVISSDILPENTKISVVYSPQILEEGEIITAKIKISRIKDDYKASYYAENVFLNGWMSDIKVTRQKDPILTAVNGVRTYIKNTLFENMDYSSAATMSAVVFGEKGYFTDEFYSNVKGAGVAHVMVVSGMHLSIIVSAILKITERFFGNGKLRGIIIFLVVIFLCGLCGFTMSIMRAGVTYIIIALSEWFDKPYSGDNSLGGAVTFITMFSPFAVLSVAFQLSVLSTFGILAVALPICRYVKSRGIIRNKIISFIFETTAISLAAMLLTLPVTIYIFGYVSTVAVITNLLITLPVDWCLIIVMAGLMINLILPSAAKVIFFVADKITAYINGVINYLGSRRFSVADMPREFAFIAVALILGVLYILIACKKRIDMIKLKEINDKVISERGRAQKWQSFLRRH